MNTAWHEQDIYNSLKIRLFAEDEFAEFVCPVEYQSTVQGVLRFIELISHFFLACQFVSLLENRFIHQSSSQYVRLYIC
jgi:hypothetical protein